MHKSIKDSASRIILRLQIDTMKHKTTLLLGTNLGDRNQNLKMARELIKKEIGLISRNSSVYETAAWGVTDQADFLNQVVIIETAMAPEVLLKKCLGIEHQMGRVRIRKWDKRFIDIDILYFEDQIIDTKYLTIPHPGIQDRRFTLVPLVEVVPNQLHPILSKTHTLLLEECPDKLTVELYLGQN